MRQLVLASTSKYRRVLLEKLHLPFVCAPPECDETPLPNETAEALVARLATTKARSLAQDFPDALIIGSDQVACLDSQIMGKPGNRTNAISQLSQLSGRTVVFNTGLCLYDSALDTYNTLVEPFNVHFLALTQQQIHAYVDIELPLDCAGSFKSEGLGITLFSKLEGDDPNALIGLPLIRLTALLRQAGIEPLHKISREKE